LFEDALFKKKSHPIRGEITFEGKIGLFLK